MKTGIELIVEERQRQINSEGWTPEHDDKYQGSQLGRAAVCYLIFGLGEKEDRESYDFPSSLTTTGKPLVGWSAFLQLWPWDRSWWKPTTPRRDLIKAGALIAAEIDRLNRLQETGG